MKLFIICFAIICLCDLYFCEEATLSSCIDHHPADIHRECYEKLGNKDDEFIQQFNETVYTNGNNTLVQLWATQVCEYANNVFSCLTEGFKNVKLECQKFKFIKQDAIKILMARESMSYLCADNGKILVDISENNGYHCLLYTDRNDDCMDILRKEAPGIAKEEEFIQNPNFCRSFNKTKECFVEKAKDCPNQKLETVAAGVFSHAGSILCDQ